MQSHTSRSVFGILLLLALAPIHESGAAPAAVPGAMSYQGVLLDDLGAPQTGPVDLVVRIYDQAAGGTLLYKQEFLGTALADGTFSLVVGPAGAATDVPTDPLTTSLADVFSGDLVSGPDRFFELTVAGDPALGRMQILSSPLSIRSESSATADTADSATSAQTVVAIDGVDPAFVGQLYQHGNFDGAGPPNDDPSEGLADPDGDGLANFIDPDNDDDGLDDAADLAAGGDINLVTPTIASISPTGAFTVENLAVTITGTNFEPGIGVTFGSETPVPSNLTATSMDVQVGPQAEGSVDVTVQRLNGESATAVNGFTWSLIMPSITFLDPTSAVFLQTLDVTIHGTDFEPGMSVTFGSESPVPTNVTANSLDVQVGPQPVGPVDVTVTRLNGASDTLTNGFNWIALVGLGHGVPSPRVETFAVRSDKETVLGQGIDNYQVSNNGNPIPNFLVNVNGVGETDWTFGPTGNLRGVKCVVNGTDCAVLATADTTGNDLTNLQFPVESITASTQASLLSADVAVNASDQRLLAYVRGRQDASLEADVVVARDYNGDDDWDDANELIALETGLADATVRGAITSTGRPVVMWDRDPSGSGEIRLAADLNGDGDFADNVGGSDETQSVAGPGVACYDVTVDGTDRTAMVYQVTGNPGITFQYDLNGDGDFGDAGETQNFSDGAASLCAITPSGASGVFVAYDNGSIWLAHDKNGDGDFADPAEAALVTGTGSSQLNLATNPAGEPELATATQLFKGF